MNQPLTHANNKLKTYWIDGDIKVHVRPCFSLQAPGDRKQILKLSNTQGHSSIIATTLLFASVPPNRYTNGRCGFYSTKLYEICHNTSFCSKIKIHLSRSPHLIGHPHVVQKLLGTYLDHITWTKPSCLQPIPIPAHVFIVRAHPVPAVQKAVQVWHTTLC